MVTCRSPAHRSGSYFYFCNHVPCGIKVCATTCLSRNTAETWRAVLQERSRRKREAARSQADTPSAGRRERVGRGADDPAGAEP